MTIRETVKGARAVMTLELRRLARTPVTPIALIIFTALTATGQWLYWRTLPPRPDDDRLFGYAFLIAIMLYLRFGFSSDRVRGSDRLIIGNLTSPFAYFTGKALALAIALLGFTVFAAVASSILSLGSLGYALWYSALFGLTVWLFTPILLLMELALDTRYPGPAVFVIFIVTVMIVSMTLGVPPLIEFLGLDTDRLDFTSLSALAWRAPISGALIFILYPLWRWRTLGWRTSFR